MESVHLGAFEVLTPIRKGGMGEVWRGIHLGQQVPVAIKVMTGKRARHPKYLQAFSNEVQAVAALDHPGIVLIFDHGKISPEAEEGSGGRFVAGSPYLVMELAGLGSLDQLRRQLRWRDLKGLLVALLDALAHAHARGVLHRDLKPANVLICGEQDPRPGLKLTDFGLASLGSDDDQRQGTTENTAGTPRYMAPEVFEGRWRDYGPWTDLYAVGCMIFELITRRPLFNGQDSISLRRQHLYSPPPRLRQLPTLPRELDRWLLRMVAKRPEDRYQCAADAAWALMGLPDPELLEPEAPGRGAGTLENQLTTLLSMVTNISGTSALLMPGDTQVAQTMIFPQQGLSTAETFILPSGGIQEAPTWLRPSVEGVANASTFLFMSDTEWRAVPRNRPLVEPEEAIAEGDGPLEIQRAPMPSSWHRAAAHSRSMRLVGAGLSLFELRRIRMVGRQAHRDAIWAALQQVQATGSARLALLSGASGVGKSRLVEWICERAHELGAATPLRASHSPITGPADGLPRMIARALRCTGLSRADTRRRIRRLLQIEGVTNDYEWDALTELVAASSTEQEQSAARAKVVRFGSPTERYVVVRRMLERASRDRPVIVWLDDVQWGSDALWFAQYLMRHQARRPCPILMLLTVNDEHLEGRAMEAHIISQLMEEPGTERLEVEALEQEAHAELVGSLLGLEGELATQVERSTHGNPMFAIQLVGSWVKRGVLEVGESGFVLKVGAEALPPEDVLDIWKARVEALIKDGGQRQEGATEALEIAACLGMDVDAIEWKEACREAGLNLTVGFLQALVQSGMVQPSEGCIAFVHGMARQALEDSARAEDRWQDHNLACARMLLGRYPADHQGVAERLGRHYLEARSIGRALGPLLDGAQERCRSGEYRHALDLLDRREWAMLTLSSSNALPEWGQGWLLRASILKILGRFKEALSWAQRAQKHAQRFKWDDLTPALTLEVAHVAVLYGQLDLAEETFALSHDLCRRHPELLPDVLSGQSQLELRRGDLQEASNLARKALLLYEKRDQSADVARCLHALWELVRMRGDLHLARDLLGRARELYEAEGHQLGVARCLQDQGMLAVTRGQLAEGSDLLQRALAFFEGLGIQTGAAACLGGLATVAQIQADAEVAERWWRRAIDIQHKGHAGDAAESRCSLALVLLDAGREPEATDLLIGCLEDARAQSRRALLARAHLGLTLAAALRADWEAWDLHLPDAADHLAHTSLIDPHVALVACRAAELARAAGHFDRARAAYALTSHQWKTLKQRKKLLELAAVVRAMPAP